MATSRTDRLAGVIGMPGFKTPVKAATTGNITLSGEQTIDAVAVVDGDRVLVKDQTTATENGIYEVDTGAWVRTKDFNGAHDVVTGALVYVNSGTLNSRTMWRCTSADTIDIGTDSITWAKAGVATDVDDVEVFTATASQTAFTTSSAYSTGVNAIDVYQNGLRLQGGGVDYTETDQNTVTLTTGATVGDLLMVHIRRMTTPGGTIDAANVSYSPAGASAVDTNVQTKLREFVSVKDFGAVGDGVTDDTAAIQAAIDAANSIGGAIVRLGNGTSLVSQVLMKSNVILEGSGYASALKSTASNTTYGGVIYCNGISNFGIRNLRVFGQGMAAADLTYAIGISNASFDGFVKDCFIDTTYLGIFVGDVSTTSSYNIEISGNICKTIGLNAIAVNTFGTKINIHDNLIYEFGQVGTVSVVASAIAYRGAQDGVIADNIIMDGQYGTGLAVDGMLVENATEGATSRVQNVAITGNSVSNVNGHGIRLQVVQKCSITGNTVRTTNGNALYLYTVSGVAFPAEDNVVCGNVLTGVTNFSGINLEGVGTNYPTNNTVVGNTITACQTGISVTLGNDNEFAANTVHTNVGEGIAVFSGDRNSFAGDKIYDNGAAGLHIYDGDDATIIGVQSYNNTTRGLLIDIAAGNTVVQGGSYYGNPTADILSSSTTTFGYYADKNGVGFFGTNPIAKQTSGADLTNSVTSGGSNDVIANFTDLSVYANDAATIRNDIYQLARKLKQVNDALRAYGLLT